MSTHLGHNIHMLIGPFEVDQRQTKVFLLQSVFGAFNQDRNQPGYRPLKLLSIYLQRLCDFQHQYFQLYNMCICMCTDQPP